MRTMPVLMCAAALGGGPAWAETVPLTQEEFDQQIIGKVMHAVPLADANQTFIVKLQEGGRAVVSSSFNDVGRWRPFEVAGYCLLWNKIGPPERCYRVARVDGKLAVTDPVTGKASSMIEMR